MVYHARRACARGIDELGWLFQQQEVVDGIVLTLQRRLGASTGSTSFGS
jgi:hypothetical protein